jgi:predicted DNA-binding transcriptional regulator AlpA
MIKDGPSLSLRGKDDILLRDTDVCGLLGVGRTTLWRWASSGKLPKPIKIGGVTRWWKSEIDGCLANFTDARDDACA